MSGITLKEVGGDLVIDVVQESTVIGRGQFLQTHTNPCFLRVESSKEQSVLTRDVKHLLNNGDEFGLLPDQLFYRVHYPLINGKDSETLKETNKQDDIKQEDKKDQHGDGVKPEAVSNGGSENLKSDDTSDEKAAIKENQSHEVKESLNKNVNNKEEGEEGVKNQKEEPAAEKDDKEEEKNQEDYEAGAEEDLAAPVDKKRVLPAWMVKAANQEPSTKGNASPKKPMSVAVNKRAPGAKLTKPDHDEEGDDDDDDAEEDKDFEEKDDQEYTPKKKGRGRRLTKLSDDDDDDYEEEESDDDYTPEKPAPKGRGGRSKKRRKGSDSEDDDFSDEDDDYSPRKPKSKSTKKTPKGKGKKKTPARGAKAVTPRSRTKRKYADDDDDEDELLPRRRGRAGDEDEDDELPSRRPQRAAKQKRGSYVDDPLIEEALEDFASEEEVVEDKDSDFEVDGVEDSGSDWERSNSQKQKVSKIKGKATGRTPGRGGANKNKKKGRRSSRAVDSDDEDDDDIMEDDEPYVPRPSKRRGGQLSQDTDSDEDGHKKKRRREHCQYGKKCYRKNPVHFRTYCHPGDSSYDEEDKDDSAPKESRKDKDSGKASPPKPSRPQRSTAGTKLVTHGTEDDDMPDTYDYQDSFIDDGTQPSEGEAEDDSDYDAEEDIRGLNKEAKSFVRGKKK
ncbi:Aprataxin and pnk-like factor [Plakobranchus ocellatus]|uniref:Aprataxin and pnk-like factor n=1 Tax=Plakobranchus ocellatus TaxID=259542 RepID=A0AAV4DVR5_9GAST|nr:Aprataxin and pnk-like factor [Plakobranchus ocellatus]